MVRKAKGDTTQNDAETTGILMDEMYDAKSLNPALESLYDEMGMTGDGDATVHISKLDSDGRGNEANVWRGDPDSYDLEQIAKTFGSGAYRVKVYVRTPEGRKPCQANKIFFWKLSPVDERKLKEAAEAPIEAKPVAQPANEMREMFAGIASMMQENTRQMIEAMKPRETNPMQTLEGLKQIAEIMKPAAVTPGMDIMSALSVATKLIDLSKGMNPPPLLNSDGDVSTGAVLLKGMEVFAQAMSKSQGAQPGAVQIPEAPALPNQQESDEMMLMFKMQLKAANMNAAKGMPPEDFADSIYDLLPDEMLNVLLGDPEWFKKLCEIEPSCAQYEAWYQSVRNAVAAIYAQESAEQDMPPDLTNEKPASIIDGKGNPADAAGTETTGKPAQST